ncbi:hypothetical protein ABI_21270 [Asticcacaulis biprosthecium C19]|uniref:STAS/SEC14 domain-containing protein n=1 Tax=Asticcacaulis biprosthecium C19 TaxID=715226 RepID=F4QGK4_9CAUL|nr:hypothetical protein [Asticcacaulis biprosthecium]EGF93685.1 hypothetical protein ABI_21270 [Asticcacaulis biprosthecium C19]
MPNGITVQINDHAHFVTFKLQGIVYGSELLAKTEEVYRGLDEPWRYNRLFDIRGFINVLQFEDFQAMAEQWPLLAGGHYPTRFAIVTDDATRAARIEAFDPMFTDITSRVFGRSRDAIGWLTEGVHVHNVTVLPRRA